MKLDKFSLICQIHLARLPLFKIFCCMTMTYICITMYVHICNFCIENDHN